MTRLTRDSKVVANTRNQAIIQEENDDTPNIIDEPDQVIEEMNNQDTAVESNSKANNFTVPVVTQNAPDGFTLDLFKQYKRRGEHCDRDLIKIHDKTAKKKDKGSKNQGLIYVDFQAGMFEALKLNMMICLKEVGVKLIADPKVELYGNAMERICLDVEMPVGDKKHDVKIKVHNTKCSMDIQGFHETVEKKHVHLNNLTIGEYFAKSILTSIVDKLEQKFDINKLNDHLRALAKEGKKTSKSKQAEKC